MRSNSKYIAAAVVAALTVLTPTVAASAYAPLGESSETGPDSTGEEVRFGTTLEDSVLLGVAGQESEMVSPMSIPFDPSDSVQCDLLDNADHVIVELYTWPYDDGSGNPAWPGGDIDLLCGTDATSGFKHIRYRHQWGGVGGVNGWETVRASASAALGYTSPQSWDEYMMHAVADTIDYSSPYPVVNNSQQKVCFSAPFYIWKGTKIYASYYANTVVSKSNFIIVTAFLSNSSWASACNSGSTWSD